jgi:hypothetical protein
MSLFRSGRSTFVAALALLTATVAACAAEGDETDGSDDALIDRNQPVMSKQRLDSVIQSGQIKSLDKLPAALPKDFLINFTLKHGKLRTGERGHLVERDVSQSSDPLAPRVIMWDERSGFTISYNGGTPGQTEGQRLDVHEFDAQTKQFKLSGLEFNGNTAPVYKTDSQIAEANRKCGRCHGPGARPIFSMYPDWPSFYGSDNDELTNMTREVQRLEANDYKAFRAQVATQQTPRYFPLFDAVNVPAKLRGTQLYPQFPYRMNHSEVSNDTSRSFAFRPSLRLGILGNRLMAQAAVEKITKHPNYAKFKGLVLHDLLECRWPNATDFQTSGWASQVQTANGAQPRMAPGGRTLHYRDLLKLVGLEVRDIDIRYSYNHEGYASDDATTNVMGVGYMQNGYWNSYFDGSATIDELISYALYKDLSTDPAFASINGLITNPDGLVVKYERRAERFKFDENFFREMDKKGMWIPIPYPLALLNEKHHREGYPERYATQHNNLCRALETKLKSSVGGPGTSNPGAPVTAGATCAPGCVYSSFCVDRNASAKKYPASGGGQVVCVKSGNCSAECNVGQ